MVILAQTSYYQNFINETNIIRDYASDFKNVFFFIRGIDKACEKIVALIDLDFEQEGRMFDSPQAKKLMLYFNKYLKAQQLGYLNDNDQIYFKDNDAGAIDALQCLLDDYRDLYCDPDSYVFDQEKFLKVIVDFMIN